MNLERRLKTFIDVAVRFFERLTSEEAVVDSPSIDFGERELLDFTGVIRISGPADGLVYVTAPTAMIEALLRATGETDMRPRLLGDFVGEMANTISSNARKDFGPAFEVSVPKVIRRGEAFPYAFPPVAFVLPIQWRDFSCQIVIAVEEQQDGEF